MEYRFEFTERAMADAEAAYDRIAAQSPERAAKWYRGLFEKIETLKTLPRRCPLAPEDDEFVDEVRQLLYGKRPSVYRVLFTIREETITILSVSHGARGRLKP